MIDEIDHQIISLLQENARLSNAALAENVGLTTSTVHERVKKLEKKGIIKGYVAMVDAEALGSPLWPLSGSVSVQLRQITLNLKTAL
jgi:Lrp/AsnC family transcriptional regulator, leucine-responsive regulatory protein